jgi:hypothetical protein
MVPSDIAAEDAPPPDPWPDPDAQRCAPVPDVDGTRPVLRPDSDHRAVPESLRHAPAAEHPDVWNGVHDRTVLEVTPRRAAAEAR